MGTTGPWRASFGSTKVPADHPPAGLGEPIIRDLFRVSVPFRDDVNPAHIVSQPRSARLCSVGTGSLKVLPDGCDLHGDALRIGHFTRDYLEADQLPRRAAGLVGGLVIQIRPALLDVRLNWLYIGSIAQVLTMLLIVGVTLRTAPLAATYTQFLWRPAVLAQDPRRPNTPVV